MLLHPFSMDGEAAKASIDRLGRDLELSKVVFTAHYGYEAVEKLKNQ